MSDIASRAQDVFHLRKSRKRYTVRQSVAEDARRILRSAEAYLHARGMSAHVRDMLLTRLTAAYDQLTRRLNLRREKINHAMSSEIAELAELLHRLEDARHHLQHPEAFHKQLKSLIPKKKVPLHKRFKRTIAKLAGHR